MAITRLKPNKVYECSSCHDIIRHLVVVICKTYFDGISISEFAFLLLVEIKQLITHQNNLFIEM